MDFRDAVPFLAMAFAACGSQEQAPPPVRTRPPATPPAAPASVAPVVMLRGTVRLQPSLTFRACDGQLLATVHDSTGERLVPAFMVIRPAEEEGMYVEALGTETRTREVILRVLEYAARPGPGRGCERAGESFLVRAFGRRPAWEAIVTGSGIELTRSGEPPLTFPLAEPDDSAGHLRYRTPGGFHLRLTPIPCTEDSTGTFASMQAVMTLEGKSLRGCASHGTVR